MILSEALTYDDVTLIPQQSQVPSRRDPDPSTQVGKTKLSIPIISAPMNTVTEEEMAETMCQFGADAVIHRYMSIQKQVDSYVHGMLQSARQMKHNPFVAIGASGDFKDRALALIANGVTKFCIDVANGHSQHCIKAVEWLRELNTELDIMAGNVCTEDGAAELVAAGANIIRVGIGPGSMCSTRLVTGHGVPQLTAIDWCRRIKDYPGDEYRNVSIVADGGIRGSGDIIKALAFGADAVMVGGIIAGTSQTPGDALSDDAGLYKMYHGMASEEGRKNWFDAAATAFVPEGSSTRVAFKGDVRKIIERLVGSVQVGMGFSNALTVEELRLNAKFTKVTDHGRREGNPNSKLFK